MSKRKEDNTDRIDRAQMSSMITNGDKMSASGFAGMMCTGVALVVFLCSSAYFVIRPENAVNTFEMMDKALSILTIGAALLGVRKISGTLSSTFGKRTINVGGDDCDQYPRRPRNNRGGGYNSGYNDRYYNEEYNDGYNDGYYTDDYNSGGGGYRPRYSTKTSTGSGADYTMSAKRSESEFDQLDG